MAKFRYLRSLLFAFLLFACFFSRAELHGVAIAKKSKKYDLVVCAVFRDEAFFLKEWLEFHKLMGVQHFYLYNNLSTDNYLEILWPYVLAGEVDLFDVPVETHNQYENLHLFQAPVYRHALHLCRHTARWAAFIDLDEFLFPVQHNDLVTFLKDYEQYPALVVNWQVYGTGNVDSLPPQGLITESLVLKAPADTNGNHMVKSLVQPGFVTTIDDPHSFHYPLGIYAVNTNGEPIKHGTGYHPSIVIDKIRINHYWFGTRDWFFNQKLARRERWGLKITPEQLEASIQGTNQIRDESILRFVPQLKARLFPVH